MSELLKVKVINPKKVIFEGEASFVLAPGKQGSLGIMPQHTALYAELVAGDLVIESDAPQTIPIERGIIKVRNDVVTVLIGL